MIISRYITRELVSYCCSITGILLLVLLSDRCVRSLSKAAAGDIPIESTLKLVGLYIPEFLSILAPLGLFIGVLFVFSRMYADSEMVVLLSCGFTWLFKVKIVLKIAFIGFLFISLITFYIAPKFTQIRANLLSKGKAVGILTAITPGQFHSINGGRLVFYVEDIESNGDILKNIFIAEKTKSIDNADYEQQSVITAEIARIKEMKDEGKFFMVLENGTRYSGIPGKKDYTIIEFAEYGREINLVSSTVGESIKSKPTSVLLKSEDFAEKIELQWRLSLPLSMIILSLIAIPLSKVRPRQGRYAKFLPAILIYILYYNLMTMSRRWMVNGVIPEYLGIWWVHLLFLLLSIYLILWNSGRLSQFIWNNK